MIHWSALPYKFHCILNLLPQRFQTLGGKATLNKAIELTNLTFHECNSNISVDTQIALFNITVDTISFLVPISFINLVSPTIYHGHILELVDCKITLIDPNEFFDTHK